MLGSLRTKPCVEQPAKTGRIDGRHAPKMPSDDSTIGQYSVGVRTSVWDQHILNSKVHGVRDQHTGHILIARANFYTRIIRGVLRL